LALCAGDDGPAPKKGPRKVTVISALISTPAAASAGVATSAADNDVIFEYGYVWLPYAVASLILFALGAVALVRARHRSPRTAEVLFVSGGVLAVVTGVIVGLADGASEGNGLATVDPPVWSFMIDHRTPALTTVAITVTTLGSTVAMSVIALATIIFLLVKRRRGDAAFVAVVAAGAGLLVRFGKATVGRERPPEEFRLVTETNESFPSGHALASAAILGVLLVVLLPSIRSTGGRVAAITGAALFVLAVGLSRLYLGVHWATDVIGGWVIGFAWLYFCLTVRRVWRRRASTPVVDQVSAAADPGAPTP
jgi:membrane-associated phospholipid phosphatase